MDFFKLGLAIRNNFLKWLKSGTLEIFENIGLTFRVELNDFLIPKSWIISTIFALCYQQNITGFMLDDKKWVNRLCGWLISVFRKVSSVTLIDQIQCWLPTPGPTLNWEGREGERGDLYLPAIYFFKCSEYSH